MSMVEIVKNVYKHTEKHVFLNCNKITRNYCIHFTRIIRCAIHQGDLEDELYSQFTFYYYCVHAGQT